MEVVLGIQHIVVSSVIFVKVAVHVLHVVEMACIKEYTVRDYRFVLIVLLLIIVVAHVGAQEGNDKQYT